MKRLFKLGVVLLAAVLCGCETVELNETHLRANGDYVESDGGWGAHTIYVKKVSPLNVFGMTQAEWEEQYGDIAIYEAYSWGAYPAERVKVESWITKAIKLVGTNRGAKYYALLNPQTTAETKTETVTSSNTSTVNTSSGGSTVATTTVTTPTTEYRDETSYTFTSHVFYFDSDDSIKIIRDSLGATQIFELE